MAIFGGKQLRAPTTTQRKNHSAAGIRYVTKTGVLNETPYTHMIRGATLVFAPTTYSSLPHYLRTRLLVRVISPPSPTILHTTTTVNFFIFLHSNKLSAEYCICILFRPLIMLFFDPPIFFTLLYFFKCLCIITHWPVGQSHKWCLTIISHFDLIPPK